MPGSLTPGTTANESPGPESLAGSKVASHLQDRCWIIPFVAACVTFLTTIIESNRGYLYVLFMEEYHADHATASWPGNILLSASHLSGFVIVLLQSKLSVFVIGLLVVALSAIAVTGGAFCPDMACMSVTVGGLYGLGYGASLTSFAIYTMMYFERYMATATALKYAAWSASGLVGPSIVSLLVNYYGLPGTLLLIGAIMLNGLPLIMLIKHPRPLKLWCSPSLYKPKPSLSSPSGEHHDKTDHCAKQPSSPSSTAALSPLPKSINRLGLTAKGVAALFRKPEFFVLLFVYALYDWTGTLHSTTCVDYGRDKGTSLETAKYVLTCNAFGHIVGRVGLSFASDKIPFSHSPMAAACLVASCLSFVGCSLVSSFTSFMVLNSLLGVSQGYVTCIRSVLISQYLSVQRLPAFFAFLGVLLIPIALSGPSILGFFRDNLGSYDNIYRLLGAANFVAAVLLCVLACRDRVRRSTWKLKRSLNPTPNGLPTTH
nr:monocarboxylate transporter 9-like [Rhipicephalus microplus]